MEIRTRNGKKCKVQNAKCDSTELVDVKLKRESSPLHSDFDELSRVALCILHSALIYFPSLRRLLYMFRAAAQAWSVFAFAEFFDHLAVERGQVGGFSAGD